MNRFGRALVRRIGSVRRGLEEQMSPLKHHLDLVAEHLDTLPKALAAALASIVLVGAVFALIV